MSKTQNTIWLGVSGSKQLEVTELGDCISFTADDGVEAREVYVPKSEIPKLIEYLEKSIGTPQLKQLLLECFENAIAPLGCGETIKPDKDSESLAQRVYEAIK